MKGGKRFVKRKYGTLEHQAGIGLYFLKEAISTVLFKARDEGPLNLSEISTRLFLERKDITPSRSNFLIFDILCILEDEGRVLDITYQGDGWIITKIGISLIQQGLSINSIENQQHFK